MYKNVFLNIFKFRKKPPVPKGGEPHPVLLLLSRRLSCQSFKSFNATENDILLYCRVMRWAEKHSTTPCLPQSHRMKFDSIDHLFIFEQQFWNILLVIEFPHIFFL